MEAVLYGRSPSAAVLRRLEELQRPDGALAWQYPRISTVCETSFLMQWLDDLGLHDDSLSRRALSFLLDGQRPDGGWDEVEDVRQMDVPPWMLPGSLANRMWLSACCGFALALFFRGGAREKDKIRLSLERAAAYLSCQQDEEGRLPGPLRATWVSIPVLAAALGPDSARLTQAVRTTAASLTGTEPASYYAWMLDCLRAAGLPEGNPLVNRCLDLLEAAQRADGSWEAEDGEEYAVDATIRALKGLRAYGRI